jgi:uncharacterized protein (TIGR02271 family)
MAAKAWSRRTRLFGGEPADDSALYERSIDSGSTVVTVKASGTDADDVMDILDKYAPIDLDARATDYGLAHTCRTTTMADTSYAATAPIGGTATTSDTIQLAEERLAVGKRLVSLGGTRVRRFVVETPVEQQVTLHAETVTLERHPVTDGRPVAETAFTETTIEMLETAEQAVVAKTAVVTEEIRLHKEATDRVETIRDTVRREDVEIEQLPAESVTGAQLRSAAE